MKSVTSSATGNIRIAWQIYTVTIYTHCVVNPCMPTTLQTLRNVALYFRINDAQLFAYSEHRLWDTDFHTCSRQLYWLWEHNCITNGTHSLISKVYYGMKRYTCPRHFWLWDHIWVRGYWLLTGWCSFHSDLNFGRTLFHVPSNAVRWYTTSCFGVLIWSYKIRY
jgi:hypothetical protein